jgi:hypothetical protein
MEIATRLLCHNLGVSHTSYIKCTDGSDINAENLIVCTFLIGEALSFGASVFISIFILALNILGEAIPKQNISCDGPEPSLLTLSAS